MFFFPRNAGENVGFFVCLLIDFYMYSFQLNRVSMYITTFHEFINLIYERACNQNIIYSTPQCYNEVFKGVTLISKFSSCSLLCNYEI